MDLKTFSMVSLNASINITYFDVIGTGCQVKSCVAERIFLVWICTVLEQKSDNFSVTLNE